MPKQMFPSHGSVIARFSTRFTFFVVVVVVGRFTTTFISCVNYFGFEHSIFVALLRRLGDRFALVMKNESETRKWTDERPKKKLNLRYFYWGYNNLIAWKPCWTTQKQDPRLEQQTLAFYLFWILVLFVSPLSLSLVRCMSDAMEVSVYSVWDWFQCRCH